jgi:hypothetical protein
MFLERKILEKIHGEKFFHFDAILGWKHLQDDIDHFGSSNPLTKLMPNLEGIDPDDVRWRRASPGFSPTSDPHPRAGIFLGPIREGI